jgi:hypothetical protein
MAAGKAAATDAALGGPEDPVADAAAAGEYAHARHAEQQDQAPDQGSHGVLLAIAIILLWLAAFAFFIAFEGAKLLGADADTSGGGLLKAMISGLAQRAQSGEEMA